MKFIKKNLSTIVLVMMFVVGLSLLLYPTFSEWWNSYHQSRAIHQYDEIVSETTESKQNEMIEKAKEYNETLVHHPFRWYMNEEEEMIYNSLLNLDENGIMAYVNVPSLRISLPVYHGTSEEILQVAIGQIPGSSLPVGGESTHCVISGHRGLPSARLFTDIDQLVERDIFTITVLNQVLTYEVDQIRIVEPDDVDDLAIIEGEDYCTLVTCTPYGVNTHRLLVRGKRIETSYDSSFISFDALQYDEELIAIFIAVPILLLMFSSTMLYYHLKERR